MQTLGCRSFKLCFRICGFVSFLLLQKISRPGEVLIFLHIEILLKIFPFFLIDFLHLNSLFISSSTSQKLEIGQAW